jgi:hypothetical protein
MAAGYGGLGYDALVIEILRTAMTTPRSIRTAPGGP